MTATADLTREWDVVVVGAGPAGTMVARQLAIAGVQTLLVEQKPFPRWKVCGACINPAAIAVLEQVGLGELLESERARAIQVWDVSAWNRRIALPVSAGVALSRAAFDSALAQAAVAAGARFIDNVRASVEVGQKNGRFVVRLHGSSSDVQIRARRVVDAGGLGSHLVASIPVTETIRRRSRIGAGAIVDLAPAGFRTDAITMAVGSRGYVGIVQLEDGRWNLGAALDPQFAHQVGGLGHAAAAIVEEAKLPPIEGLTAAHWRGTPALTRRRPPVDERGMLRLGDAAGYVEPFTGEGMAWALRGAVLLAPLIAESLQTAQFPLSQRWTTVYNQNIRRQQFVCRAVAMLLRHPMLACGTAATMARFPALFGPIIRRLHHPALASAIPANSRSRPTEP